MTDHQQPPAGMPTQQEIERSGPDHLTEEHAQQQPEKRGKNR